MQERFTSQEASAVQQMQAGIISGKVSTSVTSPDYRQRATKAL
ncbi:hypothetical protein SBA1_940029 [Candidatus Sulfotelmatobacter kueseliae]|uniref:Uncharacterized protein n=1 Tax=Candidatus Sulfotelmatobacter kueseliae TaxID=2042962 RepID=A0A2U3LCV7_9BACT|nr:hypothetical protein SBA1_940029 [Candidatus Sulfotelmatobacter kueseliae]